MQQEVIARNKVRRARQGRLWHVSCPNIGVALRAFPCLLDNVEQVVGAAAQTSAIEGFADE